MFANRKYEELSYPQKSENVRPIILVTLLKMRPHYGQSSSENSTPIQWHIPISLLQGSTPPPGYRRAFCERKSSPIVIYCYS